MSLIPTPTKQQLPTSASISPWETTFYPPHPQLDKTLCVRACRMGSVSDYLAKYPLMPFASRNGSISLRVGYDSSAKFLSLCLSVSLSVSPVIFCTYPSQTDTQRAGLIINVLSMIIKLELPFQCATFWNPRAVAMTNLQAPMLAAGGASPQLSCPCISLWLWRVHHYFKSQ